MDGHKDITANPMQEVHDGDQNLAVLNPVFVNMKFIGLEPNKSFYSLNLFVIATPIFSLSVGYEMLNSVTLLIRVWLQTKKSFIN